MSLLWGLLLLAVPVDSTPRVVQARFTTVAPVIDGVLEPAWQAADSVSDFVQLAPDYDEPASDTTVAYLLYDNSNLYVAFRCLARDATSIVAPLSGTSDGIRIFLDTFDDNASCYEFMVQASGVEYNYRVTCDGNDVQTWDGVWRSAARIEPWGYAVEIEIPFKTLRFPAGRTAWGVDFGRYFAGRGERSYWCRYPETGFKVSHLGTLSGIRVPDAGLHLEVYPVGLGRAEKTGSGSAWHDAVSGSAGIDLAWLPTQTANVQLTARPDFAQIEADPTQVNLSKYELSLSERRPFFVEAAENFTTAFSSVKLFYSRRIGKGLPDGSVVPILGGAKYTDRLGRYRLGTFAALTGAAAYDYYGTPATEPASWFTVASVRRGVLANSEVGLLYAGKDNERVSNHGASLDGTFRSGDFTAAGLGAGSQRGDSLDWAGVIEAQYLTNRMMAHALYRQVGAEFDMNGPGFTTWRGRYASVDVGPELYARGPFRYAQARLSVSASREWAMPADDYGRGACLSAYGSFRSQDWASVWWNWYADLYEDTAWHGYHGHDLGLNVGTADTRPLCAYLWWDHTTRSYNYNRMELAPISQGGVDVIWRVSDKVSLDVETDAIVEFPESGPLEFRRDVTFIHRPRIDLAVTPKMTVGLGNELVQGYDAGADRTYSTYRLAALYSYTFRPRSTFYFAWNWDRDEAGRVTNVQVVKLRYLFVF